MSKLTDMLFVRDGHVCPWWMCFTFDNIFRRMVMKPEAIVSPWVHEGCAALDIGPGRGFFTIPIALLAGESGSVTAVDIQTRMLGAIERRAERAGVAGRVTTKLISPDTLGIEGLFDFILAFWMVHEVPDRRKFLGEVRSLLKSDGVFFMAEPGIHVTAAAFERTEREAADAGLVVRERPKVFGSRTIVFGAG